MVGRRREMIDIFTDELEARGVSNFSFEGTANHTKLIVRRGEQSRFVVFSQNAGDRRAMKNNIATLRKELNVLGFPR